MRMAAESEGDSESDVGFRMILITPNERNCPSDPKVTERVDRRVNNNWILLGFEHLRNYGVGLRPEQLLSLVHVSSPELAEDCRSSCPVQGLVRSAPSRCP